MKQYMLKKAVYVPAKAERLDGVTNRTAASPVTLLFLLKNNAIGEAVNTDVV